MKFLQISDAMLLFCPTCANILECEEGANVCYRFACSTCPYIYTITKRISNKTYTKLKEVCHSSYSYYEFVLYIHPITFL